MRTAPHTGSTGDAGADLLIVGYEDELAKVDPAIRGEFLMAAIDAQEDTLGGFYRMELAGIGDAKARRSHALALGRLRKWLGEARAADLDTAGQDVIEGRRSA